MFGVLRIVFPFLISYILLDWVFEPAVIFLDQNVHHREHEAQFFWIKVLLPIKKKKNSKDSTLPNLF